MNTEIHEDQDFVTEEPEVSTYAEPAEGRKSHFSGSAFFIGVVVAVLLLALFVVGYWLYTGAGDTQSPQADQSTSVTDSATQAAVTLSQKPTAETYERFAQFTFEATAPVECRVNNDAYTPCETSVFFPDIPEGSNTFVVRAVADQEQLAMYQWDVLDVFTSGTPDLLVSNQTPSNAEPRSWKGIVRINCDFSHSSYNDPIVFPGEEGAAHLHRFYGNELLDHTTTMESLIATGSSTCQGNNINRTAYWIPALLAPLYNQQTKERQLDDNGNPAWQAVPAVVGNNEEAHEVFYYSAGIDDLEAIEPIPPGLRMIAGEATTKPGREQDASIVRWHCQSWESTDAGNPLWSATIPECRAPDRLRMDIFFPSCWNGRDLDSANHKSHMAYPVRDENTRLSSCPASHPVAIVRPSYHYAFGVLPNVYDPETKSSTGWRLASDDYEVTDINPGGLSLHGDWFNAWHPTIMEAMLETCIQGRLDCHNGNLANGWRLADVHEGVQNSPVVHNGGAGGMSDMTHTQVDTNTPEPVQARPPKERPTRE